jgi:hypothetical protein
MEYCEYWSLGVIVFDVLIQSRESCWKIQDIALYKNLTFEVLTGHFKYVIFELVYFEFKVNSREDDVKIRQRS